MTDHLSAVPDDPAPLRRDPDDVAAWPFEDLEPLRRPRWWRWVALAVVLALVVATPLAYGVSILLR